MKIFTFSFGLSSAWPAAVAAHASAYSPRDPEESLLYQVVAQKLERFLASHPA